MANYKFIVNPAAARGKCARMSKKIIQLCTDRQMDYDLVYTSKAGDGISLADEAKNQFDCVVAVGGDGTINEVVNGIMGGSAKLGIIPIGSGNDFIKVVDVPLKLDRAINNLVNFKTKSIDIGKANDRYFQNGLGIGFDAWVVDQTLRVKKLRGTAIYFYSVLKTIYSYTPPLITLSYNDIKRQEYLYMINAGNGTSMGGGFKLTPLAIIDDGLLDLNIVRNLKKWEIYKNLIAVFAGKHIHMEQVTTGRTNYFTIESDEGFAAHVDGELLSLSLNSLNVELLPRALEVVVS